MAYCQCVRLLQQDDLERCQPFCDNTHVCLPTYNLHGDLSAAEIRRRACRFDATRNLGYSGVNLEERIAQPSRGTHGSHQDAGVYLWHVPGFKAPVTEEKGSISTYNPKAQNLQRDFTRCCCGMTESFSTMDKCAK
jgi:hypothetical protein